MQVWPIKKNISRLYHNINGPLYLAMRLCWCARPYRVVSRQPYYWQIVTREPFRSLRRQALTGLSTRPANYVPPPMTELLWLFFCSWCAILNCNKEVLDHLQGNEFMKNNFPYHISLYKVIKRPDVQIINNFAYIYTSFLLNLKLNKNASALITTCPQVSRYTTV